MQCADDLHLARHFGSLEPKDVKRLRPLEQENQRLKKGVFLGGLPGIVELTPVKRLVDAPPTSLIVRSTLIDNDGARAYFVQNNVSRL